MPMAVVLDLIKKDALYSDAQLYAVLCPTSPILGVYYQRGFGSLFEKFENGIFDGDPQIGQAVVVEKPTWSGNKILEVNNIEHLYSLALLFKEGDPKPPREIQQNLNKYAICLALIVYHQAQQNPENFDPKYLIELSAHFAGDETMAPTLAARLAEVQTAAKPSAALFATGTEGKRKPSGLTLEVGRGRAVAGPHDAKVAAEMGHYIQEPSSASKFQLRLLRPLKIPLADRAPGEGWGFSPPLPLHLPPPHSQPLPSPTLHSMPPYLPLPHLLPPHSQLSHSLPLYLPLLHSQPPHSQPPHSQPPHSQPPHSQPPHSPPSHSQLPHSQPPHSPPPHSPPPHSPPAPSQPPHSQPPHSQPPHSPPPHSPPPHSPPPHSQLPHSPSPDGGRAKLWSSSQTLFSPSSHAVPCQGSAFDSEPLPTVPAGVSDESKPAELKPPSVVRLPGDKGQPKDGDGLPLSSAEIQSVLSFDAVRSFR